jgi:hypothetical protein
MEPAGAGMSIVRAFTTALSLLSHGKLIVPLLTYFAVKILLVILYTISISEPWSSLWAFFLRGVTGNQLSHYPTHLLLMPLALGRLDMILQILLNVIFQGATILLVTSAFKQKQISLKDSFGGSARRYVHLVCVSLVTSIVILLCVNFPNAVINRLVDSPRMVIIAAAMLLGLVIQAFFIYAMPLVILEHHSAIRAIGNSFRMARRFFGQTFLIAATPFVLMLPTTLLSFKAQVISLRLSPEFMIHIQTADEVMQLIATYLFIGGLTINFIRRRRNSRESKHRTY